MQPKTLILSLLVLVVALAGCGREGENPTGPDSALLPEMASLTTISTPATLVSARLYLFAGPPAGHEMSVHQILVPWTESTVTWNSFFANANPFRLTADASASNPADAWMSFDVTATVQRWNNGEPNHGLLVASSSKDLWASVFPSSESATEGLRPYLELTFKASDGTLTVYRLTETTVENVDDAYIWESHGEGQTDYRNLNLNSDQLWVGLFNGFTKYSLIRFDFTIEPPRGCTRTQGYWKTHSSYGPAPYDATWGLIDPLGERSPFFGSGLTHYQVINSSTSGGNAYFTLGRQYIAAKLNLLAGASAPPAVARTIGWAENFFRTYTPTSALTLRVSIEAKLRAGILDVYNNGLLESLTAIETATGVTLNSRAGSDLGAGPALLFREGSGP